MGLNLLEKTELWVNEITLANANLSDMARWRSSLVWTRER